MRHASGKMVDPQKSDRSQKSAFDTAPSDWFNCAIMNSQEQTSPAPETRRSFIKKTAGVAAALSATNIFKTPVYGQTQAPSPGRVIGANDRLYVAYIGVGNQGMAHVRHQKDHASDN